jgi:DNA-directed RNA polymerase
MLVTNLKTNLSDPSFEPSTREERMALGGRDRYRARQQRLADRGTAADRDDYASVIRRSLLGVAERISQELEDNAAKTKGRPSALLLKLETIEGDKEGYRGVTVAYITLSTIFNSLAKTNDKAKIATSIGLSLELEARFNFIASTQPKMWSRLVRFAKERGSMRHKTRFVLNTAEKEGVSSTQWDTTEQTLLGHWLIGLVEKAELISTISSTVKGYTVSEIVLQDHVLAWLEEYREKADAGSLPMVSPVLSPMTTVPRDWSSLSNGGYEQIRYQLVQAGKADYRSADMSRVFAAVNLMQRTPWRVNGPMLALVERLWAEGQKIGKLPIGLQMARPERLSQEDWEQLDETKRKARLLENREVHAHNRQAASDLATIDMVLAQARELQDEPAIYMPYFLDYRGRAYCQPLFNPQKSDPVRAILELANGKPVGERGAMWLAIQVATLWDGEFRGRKLSKASFQDRYDWTVENEALLRSVVSAPCSDRAWANADKPFMFLRTAMDWVGFLDEGENFISSVPIALDGSCSGIQHYAALLRDEATGVRVNILPSDAPADVYGDVARMVLPMVEARPSFMVRLSDGAHQDIGNECADFWLDYGISRKIVKKPVMTYGYSSREPGFTEWYDKQYVRPTLKQQGKANVPSSPIARYLAKQTLTAVSECLPSVAAGMDWLISCASLLAHESKGIAWTTPSGFPVVQQAMSAPSVRVETALGGERLRVSVPGQAKTVNKEKQKSAIGPNYVHSLDAAHLVLTVLQAAEYGVTDFALIHDSFGTLAADTDAMFSAVRDAFVDMYTEHDPFQQLHDQVCEVLSEEGRKKLPRPPAKGSLDLSQVQQSLYAFA